MPDVIDIGPLHLQGNALALMLSGLAGYILIWFRLKRGKTAHSDEHFAQETGVLPEFQNVLDLFGSVLLIILLFWKFGVVLREPSIVWERPLALLAYWGGAEDRWLGTVVAMVYVGMRLRKAGRSIRQTADLAAFGILGAVGFAQLLGWKTGSPTSLPWGIHGAGDSQTYHPLNAYVLLICLILLAWLWVRKPAAQPGLAFRDFAVYFGLGMLAVTLLADNGGQAGWLRPEQIGYAALALLGSFANAALSLIDRFILRHNKERKGADSHGEHERFPAAEAAGGTEQSSLAASQDGPERLNEHR